MCVPHPQTEPQPSSQDPVVCEAKIEPDHHTPSAPKCELIENLSGNDLTGPGTVCQTPHMSDDTIHQEIAHALEILGLTLPVTAEDLERAKCVQLYNWNPAHYANLTNHPKQYTEAYRKAEEMSRRIKAAYMLLSAVLVPDEE